MSRHFFRLISMGSPLPVEAGSGMAGLDAHYPTGGSPASAGGDVASREYGGLRRPIGREGSIRGGHNPPYLLIAR